MISTELHTALDDIKAKIDELYPDHISGYYIYGETPEGLPLIKGLEGRSTKKVLQDTALPYIILQPDSSITYTDIQAGGCVYDSKPTIPVNLLFIGTANYNSSAIEQLLRHVVNQYGYTVESGSIDKFYVYSTVMKENMKGVDNVNSILNHYTLVMVRFKLDFNDMLDPCNLPSLCSGC